MGLVEVIEPFRREVYVYGEKLPSDFSTAVQYLATRYDLEKLKEIWKESREKYLKDKSYGKLFTEIGFATILRAGGIRRYYEFGQMRIRIDDKIIEDLIREVGFSSISAFSEWKKELRDWIIGLYAVGDLLPGVGWSGIMSLMVAED